MSFIALCNPLLVPHPHGMGLCLPPSAVAGFCQQGCVGASTLGGWDCSSQFAVVLSQHLMVTYVWNPAK